MRYLSISLLLVLTAFIQNTGFLSVAGIKPNWLLAAMFFLVVINRPLTEYIIWSLLAAVLLRFGPEPLLWPQIAFLITVAAIFVLHHFLPWARHLNTVAIVILGTIIFYLLTAPTFIYQHWTVVLGEVVYNLVVVSVLIFIWPKDKAAI